MLLLILKHIIIMLLYYNDFESEPTWPTIHFMLLGLPVLVYERENRELGKAERDLPERTEMRMSRWMMGIKRIEKRHI